MPAATAILPAVPRLLPLLGLLLAAPTARAAVETRRSELETEPEEAWQEPGFRIGLGLSWEPLSPGPGAPPADGVGVSLQPGYRLSRWWSVAATFRYAVLTGAFEGLRWTATADPSFHPFPGATLAVGAGYAGMMGQRRDRAQDLGGYSYPTCDGEGWAALARAAWAYTVGELFALGVAAQADVQWTRCSIEETVDLRLPGGGGSWQETRSIPLTLTERWRHTALSLGLTFTWR